MQGTLFITTEVYKKISWYVQRTPIEISGLGTVEIINGRPTVTEIHLVKQECTGGTTDMNSNSVMDLLLACHKRDKPLNFWWHSHADMKVFWSVTDTDTIKQFGGNGMLYSTVFNRAGEMLSSFYQKANGIYPQIYVEDLPTVIGNPLAKEETDLLEKNFTELVTEKAYMNTHGKVHMGSILGGKKEYWKEDVALDDYLFSNAKTDAIEYADVDPVETSNIMIQNFLTTEYGFDKVENAYEHFEEFFGDTPTWVELCDHIETYGKQALSYTCTGLKKKASKKQIKKRKGKK